MKKITLGILFLASALNAQEGVHGIEGPVYTRPSRPVVESTPAVTETPAVETPAAPELEDVPVTHSYQQQGRWYANDYQYKDGRGQFQYAKNAYIAKEDGKFRDGDKGTGKRRIAYKKGDILFEIKDLGWFKAQGNAPKIEFPAYAVEILRLVNTARANAGLRPVTMTPFLNQRSQNYSNLMARSNGKVHHNLPGREPCQFENVAGGQQTAQDVFNSWMTSQGHRENILNPSVRTMGIALARGPYNGQGMYDPAWPYWTQQFNW